MAELKAARTVAPFATFLAHRVPSAIAQSRKATRGSAGRERVEAHGLEDVAGEQLVVAAARRCLRPGQRRRATQQLLERLRHDHRRLRRPADDEAHEGGPDLVVGESGLAFCLHVETAAEHVVLVRPGCPPLIDLGLDMLAQGRSDLVDVGPQRGVVAHIRKLEFE